MAKVVSAYIGDGPTAWEFSEAELENGSLDGVEFDTGDTDADWFFRRNIGGMDWEKLAYYYLAFMISLRLMNAEMHIDEMEKNISG